MWDRQRENVNTKNNHRLNANDIWYALWVINIFISSVCPYSWLFLKFPTRIWLIQSKIKFWDRQGKNEHTQNDRQVMVINNGYDH